MNSSGNLVAVYVAYVIVAVVLTAWLARTLFQSGAAFLHDVFDGKAQLSQAVNRLVVVGFYILNLYESRDRWGRRRGERRADCSWCDDMRMRGAT